MSEGIEREPPKGAEADWLDRLWRRIKEHKLVQWSVAYVALAYGLQHGVTLTAEAFEWPHAVERVTMLLLILGLPVVMTFAWYHGARASRRISGPELSIISILLVIGSMLFYVFVRPSEGTASVTRPPPHQAVAGTISIAVLPFANLSGDATQEFFSDGMTEEITSALAKVKGLTVLARTSAFEFKGQNRDVRAIGDALNARYLIEGSVRKDGDRLRITAQLVQAESGANVWTENYDRQLTNIFAIQEDIAQAIASALRVPLGLQRGQTLVSNRTGDLESYQQYLRAHGFYRSFSYYEAIAILEPLVARDPNYAPGWSLLARAYGGVRGGVPVRSGPIEEARAAIQASLDKEEAAARQAIRLDPGHADGYGALATIQVARKNWAVSDDLYRQTFALDPEDIDALVNNSLGLVSRGRLKEALAVANKVRALEPLIPIYGGLVADLMQYQGQAQASIPLLEPIPTVGLFGYLRNLFIAKGYAMMGRYNEAADAILAMPPQSPVSRRSIEDAARLLRSAPKKANEPERLPALEGELGFVYAYVGASERVLEFAERTVQLGLAAGNGVAALWDPQNAPVRKTDRFKAIVRANGLVDYWKVRGWPDLCHPTTGDDFVCT